MSTDVAMRQLASRIVDQGIPQKLIAKKMGMSESRFSRWVNQKAEKGKKPPSISTHEMDRLKDYRKQLLDALSAEGDAATLSPAVTTPLIAAEQERERNRTALQRPRRTKIPNKTHAK